MLFTAAFYLNNITFESLQLHIMLAGSFGLVVGGLLVIIDATCNNKTSRVSPNVLQTT